MRMKLSDRLASAWRALCGTGMETAVVPAVATAADEPGGPEAALARARLELEAALAEAAQLREEYARRERLAAEEKSGAGSEAVLRLAKRVCPLLSQLATMRVAAEAGKPVRVEDVLMLAEKLEKAFVAGGVVSVGTVGESVAFDPRLHQRMSGAEVADGNQVRVRFVGYTCGEQVVTKAMVSREEGERE